jgi:hypothetical protein
MRHQCVLEEKEMVMSIPGFTAEAPLSKSTKHYELVADKARCPKGQRVVPQRRFVSGGRIYECDWFMRCRLIGYIA